MFNIVRLYCTYFLAANNKAQSRLVIVTFYFNQPFFPQAQMVPEMKGKCGWTDKRTTLFMISMAFMLFVSGFLSSGGF